MTARTSRFLLLASFLVTSFGGVSASRLDVTGSEASGPASRELSESGMVVAETGANSSLVRWQFEATPLD